MAQKSCVHCGGAFEARGRAKTCSPECSTRYRAEYMQDFRSRPDAVAKDRERSRARYARCKAAQSEYARARYATNEEYRSAALRRSAEKRRSTVQYRECVRCGTAFRPNTTSACCSETCRSAYRAGYEASRSAWRAEYKRAYRDRLRAESTTRLLAMLDAGSLRDAADRPYFAYMFFGRDGELLYVGITDHVQRRMYQHAEDKTWFEDISAVELATFASRKEARVAEAALIKAMRPTHNVLHNGDGWRDVDQDRVVSLLGRFKRDALDAKHAKRAA